MSDDDRAVLSALDGEEPGVLAWAQASEHTPPKGLQAVFTLVNEEGENYGEYDSLIKALPWLDRFPNDSIRITYQPV